MSGTSDKGGDKGDEELLAIAGLVVGGVAKELAMPIRELRETLAVIVDGLDHHVSSAKGPTPYSWAQVGELRDRVAAAYLLSRRTARLAGDLATAATSVSDQRGLVDVNKTLGAALNLARHRVSSDAEVFIDFGAVPAVPAVAGRLLLGLARLIFAAADAAQSTITLKSRREGDAVVITVLHDGSPDAQPQDEGLDVASRIVGAEVAIEPAPLDIGAGWLLRIHAAPSK